MQGELHSATPRAISNLAFAIVTHAINPVLHSQPILLIIHIAYERLILVIGKEKPCYKKPEPFRIKRLAYHIAHERLWCIERYFYTTAFHVLYVPGNQKFDTQISYN